ncbi:MAG: radical SAM protein [Clostridiales bacterium]|nr:radical SAM protein [Clostridiales bacterium]
MPEMSIKRYVFQKGAAKHIPVSGTFELTPRCNFNCEMCYIHMTPLEEREIGTELSTEEWINLGREAVDAGMVYLLLTGGEPLLRNDFCTIYKELAGMGLMISVNTNGALVSDRIVECLSANLPEKVNVTLYGASSAAYQKVCGDGSGYERAVRGIRMLKEAGIPVFINTTFTRNNAKDMEDIVAFAKHEKIPIRMTSYVFPPVRSVRDVNKDCFLSPETYGQLGARFDALTMNSEQKEKRFSVLKAIADKQEQIPEEGESRASSCMAGRGAFWITWDGRMLPCGMLPSFDSRLRGESFIDVWNKMKNRMDHAMLPGKCTGCSARSICPICAAVSQNVHGDTTEVPGELCRYISSYISTFLKIYQNDGNQ